MVYSRYCLPEAPSRNYIFLSDTYRDDSEYYILSPDEKTAYALKRQKEFAGEEKLKEALVSAWNIIRLIRIPYWECEKGKIRDISYRTNGAVPLRHYPVRFSYSSFRPVHSFKLHYPGTLWPVLSPFIFISICHIFHHLVRGILISYEVFQDGRVSWLSGCPQAHCPHIPSSWSTHLKKRILSLRHS